MNIPIHKQNKLKKSPLHIYKKIKQEQRHHTRLRQLSLKSLFRRRCRVSELQNDDLYDPNGYN